MVGLPHCDDFAATLGRRRRRFICSLRRSAGRRSRRAPLLAPHIHDMRAVARLVAMLRDSLRYARSAVSLIFLADCLMTSLHFCRRFGWSREAACQQFRGLIRRRRAGKARAATGRAYHFAARR